jgi:hypothetical protein
MHRGLSAGWHSVINDSLIIFCLENMYIVRASLEMVLSMKNKGRVIITIAKAEVIKEEKFLLGIFLLILKYTG